VLPPCKTLSIEKNQPVNFESLDRGVCLEGTRRGRRRRRRRRRRRGGREDEG